MSNEKYLLTQDQMLNIAKNEASKKGLTLELNKRDKGYYRLVVNKTGSIATTKHGIKLNKLDIESSYTYLMLYI